MPSLKKQASLFEARQYDQARRQAFAKYLEHVILRMPSTPKSTTSKYGLRFLAEFLFDKMYRSSTDDPAKRKQHIESGRRIGREFRDGKKIKTVSEFVNTMHLVQERISTYVVRTEKENEELDRKGVPAPSSRQIWEAYQVFTRLSHGELTRLGLPTYSQHQLLQEAFINLATHPSTKSQKLPNLYREVYQLSLKSAWNSRIEEDLKDLAQVSEHIKRRLIQLEGNELGHLKIKHAVDRLLLQAGTGQARFIKLRDQEEYISNYLSTAYIDQLTDAVHANNQLTNRFPLYLKEITLQPVGPFPLPTPDDNPAKSLLSKTLLTLKPDIENCVAPIDEQFSQLPTRPVTHVVGHFYLRIDSKKIKSGKQYSEKQYQGFSQYAHLKMRKQVGDDVRVPFTVTTTGIGGTNSLLTKVINQAALTDINGLRGSYFPIAHDLFVKQNNFNQRVLSPVENHSLVQLCDNQTIARAMQASGIKGEICSYEDFGDHDTRGVGNYSNFDMLLGAANAALLSRLEAISKTDIGPERYILGILERTEQQYLLEQGQSFLTGYPFSSFALTSWINHELLDKSSNTDSSSADSNVLRNARLLIAETFLAEGAYRKAYPQLKWLHERLKKDSEDGVVWLGEYGNRQNQEPVEVDAEPDMFHVVSGQILARYEVCLARYLTILEENEEKAYFLSLFSRKVVTREDLVLKAWEHLTRAEKHLTVRLVKYHIIDEISQATFHPHYQILARIYYYRARLFLWYPALVPPDRGDYKPPVSSRVTPKGSADHASRGRLYLFERARVYAACNGHKALYVACTTYQSRVWLMTAFTLQSEKLSIQNKGNFSKQDCLDWARKLRNHALIQYAPIGQRCYHETKEKSGLSGGSEKQFYGKCLIEAIASIRETVNPEKPVYNEESGVLYLDMNYLAVKRGKVDDDDAESTKSIYLFGPKACHLFFIRGLYHLCSDDPSEFENSTSEKSDKSRARRPTLSLEEWDTKLERCYHLFNYAWSIAGDGCGMNSGSPNKETERYLTRDMQRYDTGLENGITDAHAMSVWSLYPHRVTEIADLGKVFAAACAALRLNLCPYPEVHLKEMNALLRSLPCADNYQLPSYLKPVLDGQKRFNGYLVPYLKQCSEVIEEVAKQAEAQQSENKTPNAAVVDKARQELLSSLFSLYNAQTE